MLSTKESTILTNHAAMRMASRGIKQWQVNQVMQYGRISYVRSSTIYAIGKKEIKEYGKFLEKCNGIHVLCSSDSNVVITTYRNQDMKGLKL